MLQKKVKMLEYVFQRPGCTVKELFSAGIDSPKQCEAYWYALDQENFLRSDPKGIWPDVKQYLTPKGEELLEEVREQEEQRKKERDRDKRETKRFFVTTVIAALAAVASVIAATAGVLTFWASTISTTAPIG